MLIRTLTFATLALLLISAQANAESANGTGGGSGEYFNYNSWQSGASSYEAPATSHAPLGGFTGTAVIPENSDRSSSDHRSSSDDKSSSSSGFVADPDSKESIRYQKYLYEKRATSGDANVDSIIDGDVLLSSAQKAAKKLEAAELIKRIQNGSTNMNGDNATSGGGSSGSSGSAKDHSNESYGPGYASGPESINDYSAVDPGFTEKDLPGFQEYDIEQISADKSKKEFDVNVEHTGINPMPDDMKAKYDVTNNYFDDAIKNTTPSGNGGIGGNSSYGGDYGADAGGQSSMNGGMSEQGYGGDRNGGCSSGGC
ncbi:MAG TPA: hypothetical protein DCY07_06660 [Rhodospirillaceae bacterium]|nr:hypothetical protein [Rhodospirillaceae bacterium]